MAERDRSKRSELVRDGVMREKEKDRGSQTRRR